MTRSGSSSRATLISVVGLGILYVITSLAFVSAYPESSLIEDAQNPAGPFFVAMGEYGNQFFVHVMEVLHPHRLVRVRDGLPQRGHALLLRDGPGGDPAQGARQDARDAQVAVRGERVPDGDRPGARAGVGHRLRVRLRRRVRHRLRPHLHDDGRAGRGLADGHPDRLRAGRDRLAPAPQAPRLVLGRGRRPDHRHRRPGVRALPAVREHRRAGRHDRLRRPDRPDRDHRRGRSRWATRSGSSGPTARSST